MKKIIYSDFLSEKDIPEDYSEFKDEPLMDVILSEYKDMMFEELEELINNLLSKNDMVAFGEVGRWNGKVPACLYIKNFGDFSKLMTTTSICDSEVFAENKRLYVKTSHHDGINYFEVKLVNKRGRSFLENNDLCFDNIKKVFDKYSLLPKIV